MLAVDTGRHSLRLVVDKYLPTVRALLARDFFYIARNIGSSSSIFPCDKQWCELSGVIHFGRIRSVATNLLRFPGVDNFHCNKVK